MTVHLAVAGDVFDGVLFMLSFSQEMSWMRFGTELRQFLRLFLPTLVIGRGYRGSSSGFLLLRKFSVAIFVRPYVRFILNVLFLRF